MKKTSCTQGSLLDMPMPEKKISAKPLPDMQKRMSRLERLMEELCPNGVEYKKLEEVCEIRSGWGFPNSEQGVTDEEIPFYKVSDMNNIGNDKIMNISNNYISKDTAKN